MPVPGTTLRVPAPRRRLVPRERLIAQLRTDPTTMPRLVLISAPAGFGKTTLLSQWLSSGRAEDSTSGATSQNWRVGWLSLDAADADPGAFLAHLVAALQVAAPEVGADALALIDVGRALPVEDIIASLVNDLDALAGPTIVALDDYHVIDTPEVHRAVGFLLDHLPPQVTLAMTTREDPPLPLSRLRARGELLEVRAADLRFTTEEADTFLNQIMGLRLDPALVAALETRTEGWAAGLQLAALSARGHINSADDRSSTGEVAAFVEAFTGSHRFVVDYLLEDVLASQPEDVRTFLLDTSVLDQLSGGLCDALTGSGDGQEVLEDWSATTCFSSRSTTSESGTATTTSSLTHCVPGSKLRAPLGSMPCTGPPASGMPSRGRWPTPSATPSPRPRSSRRPTCWNSRCQTLGNGGTTGPCVGG